MFFRIRKISLNVSPASSYLCIGELGKYNGTPVLDSDYFFETSCSDCAGGQVQLDRLKMSWYGRPRPETSFQPRAKLRSSMGCAVMMHAP
jgi:hypothetical protein